MEYCRRVEGTFEPSTVILTFRSRLRCVGRTSTNTNLGPRSAGRRYLWCGYSILVELRAGGCSVPKLRQTTSRCDCNIFISPR